METYWIHLDLQLHDIPTSRRPNKTRANVHILLIHRADIARRRIVIKEWLLMLAEHPMRGGRLFLSFS